MTSLFYFILVSDKNAIFKETLVEGEDLGPLKIHFQQKNAVC